MLHAKMMPLLGEVYNGKIGKDEAALGEYGGQKMETQVVEGIKIAAIDQVSDFPKSTANAMYTAQNADDVFLPF